MIYFDSAATTLQKPASVAEAVAEAVTAVTTPGRGDHPPARRAAELMLACRTEAAELFHAADPEQVVFTCNATHGLNIAIKSLVAPGDTVVISGYEHNAVTRPLTAIGGVTVRVVNGRLFDPAQMAEGFARALDGTVKAAVCTHVSNVFGYALPIEEIAALCRRRGIPLIVDASQSAGILPVDVEGWGAAYVAMPGHKGLYGPQGTGLLLCGSGQRPRPLLEGGTGSLSRQQEMPDFLPDRLEAGTQNVHGVAGLLAGIRFVRELGTERIARQEGAVMAALGDGLPTVAECGGFLYLQESLEDGAGVPHALAGAVSGKAGNTGRVGRFGYITMTARADGLLCRAGERLNAHEFHYWDSTAPGADFHAQKPLSGRGWDCAFHTPTLYAGFPHLHFGGCPAAAARFVAACTAYERGTHT